MEKYILVKGDISGIQEFIFNVKSKGAAKSLRARSFFIDAIMLLAVEKIKSTFNKLEIIYIGGGNFYCKIPFYTWDLNKFNKLKIDIYNNLLNTNLSLNLAFVENAQNYSYGKLISLLNHKTNVEKLQKFSNGLYFENFNKSDHLSQNNFIKLTEGLLDNSGYEIIDDRDVKKEYPFNITRDSISLFGKKLTLNKTSNKYKTLVAKWTNKLKSDIQDTLKDIEIEDPIKINNVIGFEYLGHFSKIRTGTDKIAALKLDIDNLGLLFQQIENEKDNIKLSDSFNNFFGEKLSEIILQEELYKNNLYVVFAGGDDTFIIGAWDVVIDFTYKFRKEFEKFEKNIRILLKIEKPITFSASITIIDSHYPIVKMSELAEERLEKSKSSLDSSILDATNSKMKNKVAIFNKIYTWEEFDKLREIKNYFFDMLNKHSEKRTFLQKIQREFESKDNLTWNINGKPYNPAVLWRFKYHFRDLRKQNYFRDEYEKIFFEKNGIYEKEILDKFDQNHFYNQIVPAASRWAELLTRNKIN